MAKHWKSEDGLTNIFTREWEPGEHAAYAKRVDEALYGDVNRGLECGVCRSRNMVDANEMHGLIFRRKVNNAMKCADCGWKTYV